jgi:uncharacterized RDD family membrane protein YckC
MPEVNRSMLERGSAHPVQSARPAGVAVRLGARAFDFFLALIVVISGSLIPGARETATATTVSFWSVAFAVSVTEGGLVYRWGRTPGMALCGLRISTADGARVPLWRATFRAAGVWTSIMLGCFASGAAGPIILLVALAIMVGPMIARGDRRGGHDLITGTFVTRVTSGRFS